MSDLHEEIRKQLDADLGRINGIPIVPGRPWPNRPAPDYESMSNREKILVAARQGGKTLSLRRWLEGKIEQAKIQNRPIEPWMTLFRGRGQTMSGKPFKVTAKRKEDRESARMVSAVLNSEPFSSAIQKAMGEAWEDLFAFGAMRPASYYMDKALSKDPRE